MTQSFLYIFVCFLKIIIFKKTLGVFFFAFLLFLKFVRKFKICKLFVYYSLNNFNEIVFAGLLTFTSFFLAIFYGSGLDPPSLVSANSIGVGAFLAVFAAALFIISAVLSVIWFCCCRKITPVIAANASGTAIVPVVRS